MPDEDASFVHAFVELVLLELTTAPQSDHVKPAEKSVVFDFFISGAVCLSHRHLRRNIVSSTHVDIVAVEVESEGSAIVCLAELLYYADAANSSGD